MGEGYQAGNYLLGSLNCAVKASLGLGKHIIGLKAEQSGAGTMPFHFLYTLRCMLE